MHKRCDRCKKFLGPDHETIAADGQWLTVHADCAKEIVAAELGWQLVQGMAVKVITYDADGVPLKAAVKHATDPVAIMCQMTPSGWEALYGMKGDSDAALSLPHCFELNAACIAALTAAS